MRYGQKNIFQFLILFSFSNVSKWTSFIRWIEKKNILILMKGSIMQAIVFVGIVGDIAGIYIRLVE